MTSYNEQVQEDAVRISKDLFGPCISSNYEQNYPQNYLDSSSQMSPLNYPQNYQRRVQLSTTPQMSAPYYTSTDPNVFIPQGALQPTAPYVYEDISSVSSSQFTAPISSIPSTGVPEIQEADVSPSRSVPTPTTTSSTTSKED
jgi:hypothetical protein